MYDDIIRHSIWVQRYAGGMYKELLPELKTLRDKINLRILSANKYELEKLSILMRDIDAIISQGLIKIQPSLWSELAEYENKFVLKILDENTTEDVLIGAGLNPKALATITASSTVTLSGNSLTINGLIKTFSDRYSKDIKNSITMGIAEGKTLQQITKDVRIMSNNRTRQQAEAVVRTVTNHISNEVMREVFAEYNDLFQGEEWVSVLDARTSAICGSLDGKVFPMDKGPRPPIHYQCRSRRVPLLKDEYSLGIRDTRASMSGQVSKDITYEQWLKRQSVEVQNEVLGKTRAELFRNNSVPLGSFVDKTGKTYTLSQLKKRDVLR